jgi:hypothetical protein
MWYKSLLKIRKFFYKFSIVFIAILPMVNTIMAVRAKSNH